MEFNINDKVTVWLTDYGLKILPDTYKKYDLKDGNALSLELWNVMGIFGPYMSHGGPQVFINNRVVIG